MADSNSVIEAMRQALNAAPNDPALRLHLASLLLGDDAAEEALEHFSHVLATDPVNIQALEGARDAAERCGHAERSQAYATLLNSLGGSQQESPPAPNPVSDVKPVATSAPADDELEPKLRAGGAPSLRVVGGRGDDLDIERDNDDDRITLADVAGLENVKRRIDLAFLGPLKNPAMARAYGKRMRGGLLLYGPPGCGKTYIARALAGELEAGFMSIGLSDVLNMYIGESEQRLHALFETARTNAPTVMFIDELDALGRKRSDLGSSASRQVVNQLLQEMDGVNTGDEPVFVLGATNLPWDIDAALKRPGRFDRAIFVEPPDVVAREAILSLNLEGRPTDGIDFSWLAKKTKGFSGADLSFICELATESTLERAMKTGNVESITNRELKSALREIRPSIASWFETARNYVMFANAGGEFNDLAEYMQQNKI